MLFSRVREDGHGEFFYPHREAREVYVTGSFCGWKTPGAPLRCMEYGFLGDVGPLPMGDTEYKFVVDGRWVSDPLNLVRRGDDNAVIHRGGRRGAVALLSFRSPALSEERGYVIYLPPDYPSAGRRFPVLYLLHGALDWERSWQERADLGGVMDGLRASGRIGDMIVVTPRDNGDLYRGDGRFFDYLSRDVVGHVDYEFRTLADPRHRAIDGLSTGGFTSIIVGATRRHVYRSVGSMSGSHDDRTFATIRSEAGGMRESGQRYRIFSGLDEPPLHTCRAVARELDRAGVPAVFAEAPGGHEWPLWRGALPAHLAFHWDNIKG